MTDQLWITPVRTGPPLCYACGQAFPPPKPQRGKICEDCKGPYIPKNYDTDTRCAECHARIRWVK